MKGPSLRDVFFDKAGGQKCPACGANLNAHTGPSGMAPQPGDFSVCLDCASPLRFDDHLKLHSIDLEYVEPAYRADLEFAISVAKRVPKAN